MRKSLCNTGMDGSMDGSLDCHRKKRIQLIALGNVALISILWDPDLWYYMNQIGIQNKCMRLVSVTRCVKSKCSTLCIAIKIFYPSIIQKIKLALLQASDMKLIIIT